MPYRGPSPIRAKTYGKEPLRPSIWESCTGENGRISGHTQNCAKLWRPMPQWAPCSPTSRRICAMKRGPIPGVNIAQIPHPGAIEGVKRASPLRRAGPSTLRPTRYRGFRDLGLLPQQGVLGHGPSPALKLNLLNRGVTPSDAARFPGAFPQRIVSRAAAAIGGRTRGVARVIDGTGRSGRAARASRHQSAVRVAARG